VHRRQQQQDRQGDEQRGLDAFVVDFRSPDSPVTY
jgi:hypothetical protein